MPDPKKQDQSISDLIQEMSSWLGQGLSKWRSQNQAAEPPTPVPSMQPGPIIQSALEQSPDSELNAVAKWAKQDGLLQRVLKSENPMGEPLIPKATPAAGPEPDTYWGGFAKGLKDYGRDIYNDVIRPQANLTAPAMVLGGEDSVAADVAKRIPAGLSKVEFANFMKANPDMVERLTKLIQSEAGEVKLPSTGKLAELIQKTNKGYEFAADSLKKIEEAIRAGGDLGKLWEPLQKHLAAFQDDPQAAKTFARVWGATSPNTPVARNNYEALQAWKKVMEGDIPFTPESARGADMTMVKAKVPNLNRAIAGEPVLGGRGEVGKTENMAQLIFGDKSAIPVDVHALSGAGAEEDSISKTYSALRSKFANRGTSYTDLYNIAKEAYQNGLAKFGADFPTYWEGVKTLKGQGQSAGMSSWLQKWGLLEPGAMANVDALNHVLENVDPAEFYGRALKNVEVEAPKPFVSGAKPSPSMTAAARDAASKEAAANPSLMEPFSLFGQVPSELREGGSVADTIRQLTEQNQGTTYNLRKGSLANSKSPMFAVASYPERSITYPNAPNTEQIQAYIQKNADLLKDPSNSLGTWFDKDANQFVLDISKTVPSREDALKLGKQFKQKAIFDLQNMKDVPVGMAPEEVAQSYAAKKGLTYQSHEPVKVNKEFAKNVAEAYDKLKHNPSDPAVQSAYTALKNEISDQFEHITKEGGLQVEPWTKKGQPYANSKEMTADVRKNNHLFYFPTESGFGHSEVADHPLLQPGRSGLPANDELRIVHDYLAHAAGGHSFGPNGEENAFIEHAKLLSPEARKALATETRGQNSWVNFGPHSDLDVKERPFAQQKAGLLPDELQEVYPGKKRTPPATKAPLPSDKRMEELIRKFGGQGSTAPQPTDDDMVILEHRSPKTNLDVVDPSFYGTGQAGAEKSRMNDPDFLKRSYYNFKGAPVEKRFQKLPVYEGPMSRKSIYSITEDPLNLKRKAQDLSGGDTDIARNLFERLIVSNGFKGYSDGSTVALFDKLPVTKK